MTTVAERIKAQTAQYQVDALRLSLQDEKSLRKAETTQYVKDLQVLIAFIHSTAPADLPEEVQDVVARCEELLTCQRLGL